LHVHSNLDEDPILFNTDTTGEGLIRDVKYINDPKDFVKHRLQQRQKRKQNPRGVVTRRKKKNTAETTVIKPSTTGKEGANPKEDEHPAKNMKPNAAIQKTNLRTRLHDTFGMIGIFITVIPHTVQIPHIPFRRVGVSSTRFVSYNQ
jgi:hypothetical protein